MQGVVVQGGEAFLSCTVQCGRGSPWIPPDCQSVSTSTTTILIVYLLWGLMSARVQTRNKLGLLKILQCTDNAVVGKICWALLDNLATLAKADMDLCPCLSCA